MTPGTEPNVSPAIEEALRNALEHLYDPSYTPSPVLVGRLGDIEVGDSTAVAEALRQAILALRPPEYVPERAPSWRAFHLLRLRYLECLTQEEVGLRLGLTTRHIRRLQRQALQSMAEGLMRQSAKRDVLNEETCSPKDSARPSEAERPSRQIRDELDALAESAPDSVADIAAVMDRVERVLLPMANHRQVQLCFRAFQGKLLVAAHPSVLQQILVHTISVLLQAHGVREIVTFAGAEPGQGSCQISIVVSALRDTPNATVPLDEQVAVMVEMAHGSVSVERANTIVIRLPLAQDARILIVDDNEDLALMYRRYTKGTRYTITHISRGGPALAAARQHTPSVVLLDVMLPDTDGWSVLAALRDDPVTSDIPVIVCSVIRDREVALSLGAAAFLPKPIRRRKFLETIREVLSRAHG